MAQVFSPGANLWFKIAALSLLLLLASVAVFGAVLYRSSFWTRVGVPLEQPVPFSHEHHVSGLGIDCLYCHTSVRKSSFAGMPSTETCMTCHSQIWTNAPILEPVRASFRKNMPLQWTRVNDLPDFVYFDHSIHVQKGVGCVSCHGRIDEMPITAKAETLHMRWCLDCHENPQEYVSSHDDASTDAIATETEPLLRGNMKKLHETVAHTDLAQLRNCSTCHH